MPITAGLAQPRPVEGAATTITAPECPATTTAPTKRIGAHIDPLPKYYDDVVLSSLYVYLDLYVYVVTRHNGTVGMYFILFIKPLFRVS